MTCIPEYCTFTTVAISSTAQQGAAVQFSDLPTAIVCLAGLLLFFLGLAILSAVWIRVFAANRTAAESQVVDAEYVEVIDGEEAEDGQS